ncbi:hypothetical protein GCM10011581_06120 [Saccharopolyspora subtropica]|uniref:Uncharacterized protein n=1 Tax=Saccharopolyspora thermophila TaxID=89367 RepID=A0A917JJC3_9PSEU|nr:hypothetical protein [Saccharopolyspora subtropica]GGI71920.1 hypothetical protein GCM10011581_06120 [Saccharopolyspora subtropica]
MGAELAGFVGIERVDGDVGTSVTGDGARVHTGHGPQYNVSGETIIFTESDGRVRRQRTFSRAMADEQLTARFVEPPRFARAEEKLEEFRTVFLDGPLGSGRHTAAQMLLQRVGRDDSQFRMLSVEGDEDAEMSLRPDSVQPGERLLLDLSGEARAERFLDVQQKLLPFRAAVVENNGALVVIPPSELVHLLSPEWTRLKVGIGRPSGEAVLLKHLHADGIEAAPDDLDIDVLRPHLDRAPMRDLGHLCQRIAEARDAEPQHGFGDWVARACEALADRASEVARRAKEWSAPQRAWALAAAMLKDSHADSVQSAAISLLHRLKYPKEETHVLERDGLDESLRVIDVVPNADRQVTFTKLGYDNAVRDHFWTNYPELRVPLRDWIGSCVLDAGITDADRDRLVARFAEQARRTGRVTDLCTLAERWTRREGARHSVARALQWAASALAYGLREDPTTGMSAATVRRRIYTWASQPNLSVDLAHVLISVCADVMAETHPDHAVVRLRLLAAHNEPNVAEAAKDAVVGLAEDNRFYRRLLWWMRTWLIHHSKRSDVELFLATSAPRRLVDTTSRSTALITNSAVREQLVIGWRAVLNSHVDGWKKEVGKWLSASRTSSYGPSLLGVLVDAAGGELAKLAMLHVTARDWAAAARDVEERAGRQQVSRKLASEIDAAQGLRLAYS